MKHNVLNLFVIPCVLACSASAATITFTVTGFNDVSLLTTTGALVDAAHFGADAEADVTANGITFVSRDGSSPALAIGGAAGAPYYHADLYQAFSHTAGYTTITGISMKCSFCWWMTALVAITPISRT
jgi:hypothetical protein